MSRSVQATLFPISPLTYKLVLSFYFFASTVSALDSASEPYRFSTIDTCLERAIALNNTAPAYVNLPFTLSLPQCRSICGVSYGRYPFLSVVLPALVDWVIPLFLLLGNITYAKSSSSKFNFWERNFGTQINWIAVISHLLANPLNFLWSLTLKLELGEEIWERVKRLARDLNLNDEERKHLCAIVYALSDFQGGKWVDVFLGPLEKHHPRTGRRNLMLRRMKYWKAIQLPLEATALNLANARRHNKMHSLLAIIMYGKDVFEALIQAKYDKSFPYHMPHTLALRQLYYWLFLAIIISGAAGGFANQWVSQGFLEDIIESGSGAPGVSFEVRNVKERAQDDKLGSETVEEKELGDIIYKLIGQSQQERESNEEEELGWDDIVLRPIEPWDGGNYSWMYPKGDITLRNVCLLLLVILSVGLPVAFAFYMSWSTPTIGLGDRGIMELSFMAMWIVNFGVSLCLWKVWGALKGRIWTFFMISGLWDLVLAVGSLTVLFAAFQGWFNNCESWSAYYSRGPDGAELNLKMREEVEAHIYSFYLPMVAVALVIQLVIAGVMLWMTRHTVRFTQWSDEEISSYHKGRGRRRSLSE